MTVGEPPDVEDVDLAGMREYLAETPVVFAVLFGSHARGVPEEGSDVDVALRFPPGMDDRERFRLRNRIDANLQGYADAFVDVSDVDDIPIEVAQRVLSEGARIAGDEDAFEAYRERIEAEYDRTAEERERERRELLRRLGEGDA